MSQIEMSLEDKDQRIEVVHVDVVDQYSEITISFTQSWHKDKLSGSLITVKIR